MTFKIDKTKDYTIMGNYHLRDKQLSLKAKGLLSWMLSNDDGWDYSIKGIVANCKENETAIRTTLDELKKYGYLEINKVAPDKNISTFHYEYIIHEKSINKQDPGFLGLENLDVENPVQSNTVNNKANNDKFLGSIKTLQNNNKDNKIDRYMELYRGHCGNFQRVRKLTEDRKRMILAIIDKFTWDEIIEAFDKANESDFMQGKCNGTWKADFEFFLKEKNMVKILEGKYDNRTKRKQSADGLPVPKKVTKEELENDYIYKF